MRSLQSVRIALRALRANTMRSALTMLGIIIGVAAVITMVAVGEGAHVRIDEQIRSLGTNLLIVAPGAAQKDGAQLELGSRQNLTEADAVAIGHDVPAVAISAPWVMKSAQIVHAERNWNTLIAGVEPNYFAAREWAMGAGAPFTDGEVDAAAKVAVIGETVAKALFAEGDPVGQTIRIANVPIAIAGVLTKKGASGMGRDQDNVVFVPISTAKLRLFGEIRAVNPGAVDSILVKVTSTDAMATVERQIEGLLRDRHRRFGNAGKDDFQVRNPAAAMAAQTESTRTLTFLLAAIASVSLIVGGISIMNIMLVSVTERTREIGLRLAVGARRRDIRNQFLVEAVSLCVLGGMLGILLGIAAAAAIAAIAGWAVFIGPGAVCLSAGFAAAVGIFFGFYPALKASRLDPIEALRFE
jgi:putative ABC transport system permease protein